MPQEKAEPLEKFKQVKITFRLRIEELLDLIVKGMEFLQPDKSWAESLFDALSQYVKEEDGKILDKDKDFGNMLREIDAILLGAKVKSVLIAKIQTDMGFEAKQRFQDRKLKSRKPIEDLHLFLVSN